MARSREPAGRRPAATLGRAAAVLAGTALLTGAIALRTPLTEHNRGLDSDGVYYAAMAVVLRADAPADLPADVRALATTPPWCFRPLVPWVVARLPVEVLTGFRIVSGVSAWLTLVLLYALLRCTGRSDAQAATGVLLYAGVFWTVRFAIYSPCYVDAAAQVFVLTALLAMQKRQWMIAAGVLTLGVLAREAVWTLAPAVTIAAMRSDEGRQWRPPPTAAVIALALPTLLFVGIRLLPAGGLRASVAPVVGGLRLLLANPDAWGRLVLAIFAGTGLLPVLAVVRWRGCVRLLSNEPQWAAALLLPAASMFGGYDKARLLLPALPALTVVVMAAWARWLESRGRAGWGLMATAVVLNGAMNRQMLAMGSFDTYLNNHVPMHAPGPLAPTVIRVTAAMALFLVAAWWTGGIRDASTRRARDDGS